jgi:hypothetical protein
MAVIITWQDGAWIDCRYMECFVRRIWSYKIPFFVPRLYEWKQLFLLTTDY